MNNLDFVTTTMSQRRALPSASFITWVKEQDQFKAIVLRIMINNKKWAEKVGLDKPKDAASSVLSATEIKWEKFFRSHSFDTSNSQKNFADAFSIVSELDLSRFIKFERVAVDRFLPNISIVPIGNSNEHNYKIGEPIFCYSRGTTFLRTNGTAGNSMSGSVDDYRMSNEEEVTTILAGLMYKSDSVVESLTIGLLEN
jgi:hypothetical protein